MEAPAATLQTSPAEALAAVLADLATVVGALTPEQYAAPGVHGLTGGIGGHVRHCLDHALAFAAGLETGATDYEQRLRGTAIERDADAAWRALSGLRRHVLAAAHVPPDRPLRVRVQVSPAAPPEWTLSTVGRELAFVVSHTIHHCAIIALLAQRLGQAVPPRFGHAPGTPVEEAVPACAR